MRPLTASIVSRPKLAYAALAATWLVIIAWQVVEHDRVVKAGREAVINRSRDITSTLGLVIRSGRRGGRGPVSHERVESALSELVRSGEVSSIALLNASGDVVVFAGSPIDLETKGMMQTGEHWDRRSVTIVNLVDLGANVSREGETNTPTIVLPKRDTNAPPREDDRFRPRFETGTNEMFGSNALVFGPEGGPPREPGRFEARFDPPPPPGIGVAVGEGPGTNFVERGGTRRGGGPMRFGRPFWMNEKEYQALVEKRGLHGFVIVMSTAAFLHASNQDFWLRCVVAGFAGISVLGLGLAWRNIGKSSELQMRLLRASELNTHLKEMNLAAAGLAHETRNPLNIIRGLAQMISKQQDASTEVRRKTREIIDETDRVTAQLNEFINYSRPREVRRTAVPLKTVVNEVARALTYDLEEKCVRLRFPEELPVIEADEQLLRQTLFNLLLNAVQAVERGGDIEVAAWKQNSNGAVLEIRDNGPGVDPAQRTEIFKPYFTTHQKGTGLGLAVVQQIVLAHGWEIECLPNEPRGAIFRIAHLKLATKA